MELLQGRPLTDLFVLEQARSVSQLLDGKRSIADLSLDRVRVNIGEHSLSWLELEVELAGDGSLRELRHISANLRNDWALTPQSLSKFERGLTLLDKEEKG
jgi:inorganic triphosphatase YgiF